MQPDQSSEDMNRPLMDEVQTTEPTDHSSRRSTKKKKNFKYGGNDHSTFNADS